LPDIIRVIKLGRMSSAGHVAHMIEKISAYKIFIGELEEKRPLERPRCRWEDNIRLDLRMRKCGLASSGPG